MGIPGFVRWLSNEFDVLHALGDDFHCDCLYIDLNGALHVCSHDNNLTNVPSFEDIFSATDRHINNLVKEARPSVRLCLALDGVAPRAKMNQQRGRRFTKRKKDQIVREHLQKREALFNSLGLKMEPIPDFFDSNQITPGTDFMSAANEFVHDFARRFAITHPSVEVLVSDSSVHGEGEHKIMDWLRDGDDHLSHVVVGNDSDLYLLCAVSPLSDVSIMRRQQVSKKSKKRKASGWDLVRMENFRPQLVSKMTENADDEDEFSHQRLIQDFIFLSSLAGNDFLPALPSLTLHNNTYAFADICSAYRQMRADQETFITEGLRIDYKALNQVFDILQTEETGIIRKIDTRLKKRAIPWDQRPPMRSRSDNRKRRGRWKDKRSPTPVCKSKSEPPPEVTAKLNAHATAFVPSPSKSQMKIPKPTEPIQVSSAEAASNSDTPSGDAKSPKGEASLNKNASEFIPSPKSLQQNSNETSQVNRPDQSENNSQEKTSRDAEDSKSESKLNAKAVAFSPEKMEEANIAPPGPHPLDPVKTQLEYYLSDRNLARDSMLVTVMNQCGGDRVPLFFILEFPMIKKKAKNKQEVLDAINLSSKVGLDDNEHLYRRDGKKIQDLDHCADIITSWDQEIKFMEKKIEQVDFAKAVYRCSFSSDDWHSDYHKTYTHCTSEASVFRLTESFLEGMVWVLDYYLNGIHDWDWFYHGHYSPTILDFFNYFGNRQFFFVPNTPVSPTIQLLSVLPPGSGLHLPKCFHKVYDHPEMKQFYPGDFELDFSGCSRAFQAKALLPFLERSKLEAIAHLLDDRTEAEQERDKEGKNLVYLAETKVHVWEYGQYSSYKRMIPLFITLASVGGLAFLTRSRWANSFSTRD